jgi:hypothetical protein
MEISVLAFSMLSVVLLLHNDYVAFLKVVNESSTDLMQNGVYVSLLSSAQPFQLPFCGSCAFSLERGAELPKMTSFSKNFSTFNL